jgi:short-subunit dehydrogenase
MPSSIVVFGAGPGLGRAVARRYARAGHTVVLVARRQAPLEELAADLASVGATAHVLPADLSDTDAVPRLAGQIRDAVGDPGTLYYGPSAGGFIPVAALTPERARALMPLALYSLVALVQEFLPAMLERGDGAILSAQGASAVRGMPHISGGFALAAQRNYLQSMHAAVADQGVYVGGLYIGAAIKHTPFYERREAERAAGAAVPDMPEADPDDLADLLWTMHSTKSQPEATYPAGLMRAVGG